MSNIEDARLRWAHSHHQPLGAAEEARMGKLERSRQARVGSWTEKQLHLALSSRGQRSQEELLRLACLGAGEMDRVLALSEASELLGFDQDELLEAAEGGQLASMVKKSFVLQKPGLAPG
jgi:hypothetical protein